MKSHPTVVPFNNQRLVTPSFFMSGAVSVQIQYQDMELVDTIDKITPLSGD